MVPVGYITQDLSEIRWTTVINSILGHTTFDFLVLVICDMISANLA